MKHVLIGFLLYALFYSALIAQELPTVATEHPRLWITPAHIPVLQEKIKAQKELWELVQKKAADLETGEPADFHKRAGRLGTPQMTGLLNCALIYALTGDKRQGRAAVEVMKANCRIGLDLVAYADGEVGAIHAFMIAVAYDWCHGIMSNEERAFFIKQLNEWGEWAMSRGRRSNDPSSHYFYRRLLVQMTVALATYHENPQAEELLEHALNERLQKQALPWLKTHGKGGHWPEGNGYFHAPAQLAFTFAALQSATGTDLFGATPFFTDTITYHLHTTLPAVSGEVKPIPGRHNQALLKKYLEQGPSLIFPSGEFKPDNYGMGIPGLFALPQHRQCMHIATWALRQQAASPEQQELLSYANKWLNETPDAADCLAWQSMRRAEPLTEIIEFIFGQPAKAAVSKNIPRLFHAPSTGLVTWRSDWSQDATFFAFNCGPRISAEQRRDANSIFLFKRGILLGHTPHVRQDTANCNSVLIDGKGQTVFPREQEPHLIACNDEGDYAYIAGEAGDAYNVASFNRQLCEGFTRRVIILPPGLFVVYDRIKLTDPNSTTTFRCFFDDQSARKGPPHSAETLGGEIQKGSGSIGVSKNIWGGGVAYMQCLEPQNPQEHNYKMALGWETEIGSMDREYLTLIYAPELKAEAHPGVIHTKTADTHSIKIDWGVRQCEMRLNRKGDLGGSIMIKDGNRNRMDVLR